MASHRIGARLSGLSPEQLVAFIDEQAPLWSAAAMRVAEEHVARLLEQPEWVLSEVLLSPDLAPHILAQLPTKAHAAKGTCRAWRRAWKETLKKRERQRLLVIGGYDGDGECLNSVERYDPAENAWEGEAMVPMPTARTCPGVAVLDGKLYAVGGHNDDGRLSSVERYDPATNAWEAVAPMTMARTYLGTAVLDGKLYAVGGYDFGHLPWVERYDPALDAWEEVARMARGRHSLGVAVLDGKLYAAGGFCNDEGVLGLVERYDPATNAWEAVAPMAEDRDRHAMAVLDGKLYAVGGHTDGWFGGVRLSSVERYDPAANVWEAVVPMAASRQSMGLTVLDGKLYAAGGKKEENAEDEDDDSGEDEDERSCLSSVERYDPALDAWEAVAPMGTARGSALALPCWRNSVD